jgi:UDP-glucose 4-epimerase
MIKRVEQPRAVGEVFNLGSQEEVMIEELARRVIRLTGSRSQMQYVPYEQAYEEGFEDMPRRVPDISKIRGLIGFQPSMDLNQIIESVVAGMRPAGAAQKRRARKLAPSRA